MASQLREYRRRDGTPVTAAQLDLDMDGLEYRKWGGIQRASRGDWLVNRQDEAYTVARDVFERTYRMIRPGLYEKVTSVWARPAESSGSIRTQEGETRYEVGDMLVYNDPEGGDGYAMTAQRFAELYEPVRET
jgi:hypothetical protein